MPQRNLVLFDLEWNIGYQPYTFNYHGVQQTFRGEIIEIGAVKIDEDANVLDTFSIHLRPRIFRKLQHHIAKVTGLSQGDLDAGLPMKEGLQKFLDWAGPDAELAETRAAVRAEKISEVAGEFDGVHDIHRAVRVGSVDRVITPAELRPAIIETLDAWFAG